MDLDYLIMCISHILEEICSDITKHTINDMIDLFIS